MWDWPVWKGPWSPEGRWWTRTALWSWPDLHGSAHTPSQGYRAPSPDRAGRWGVKRSDWPVDPGVLAPGPGTGQCCCKRAAQSWFCLEDEGMRWNIIYSRAASFFYVCGCCEGGYEGVGSGRGGCRGWGNMKIWSAEATWPGTAKRKRRTAVFLWLEMFSSLGKSESVYQYLQNSYNRTGPHFIRNYDQSNA